MKTIGLVTIGQSPRVDLTPDLEAVWKDKFYLLEMGALDGLSQEEIAALQPEPHETVLVSRLKNGGSARLGEERLIPLVQDKINQLQSRSDVIFLLCTGEFPAMVSQKPLLEPDSILRRTMSAIIGPQQKLGVMVPERDQQEDIVRRWAKYIPNQVITDYGTPYGQDRELIEMAAYRLKNEPVDYIVLDCLGYSQAMKETVEAITKKPVIIPRMLIAHIMMAMF